MKSKNDRVLFLGCGDLGSRAGKQLLSQGFAVAGARRDTGKLPEQFVPLALDYAEPGQLEALAEFDAGHLVVSFKPASMDARGYQAGFMLPARRLAAALAGKPPARIYFISSTRVFAENAGGWVDEHSALALADERAVAMLEAERLLRELTPCTAVYFSGLYGGSGGRLLERVKRGELSASKPERYSNRIHRYDAANFLAYLVTRARQGEALAPGYIASDDTPSLQAEVEQWLADQLSVQRSSREYVPAPGMANKRCRNTLMHDSGFKLRYSDYRSGYTAVMSGQD